MNKLVVCAIALALLGCSAEEPGSEAEQPEGTATAEVEATEATEASNDEAANDEEWPQQVRDNFLEACLLESGGQEAYCICVLEDLEASYTLAEFEEVERTLESTGVVPPDLEQIIDACIEQNL